VHQGILAQNALVLSDLNAQLQAAVRASMAEEERRMERMRAEGFLLANETAEQAAENRAYRAAQEALATLPDVDDEDEEEEEQDPELRALRAPPGEDPASEAGRRRAHMRKVLKARRAAEKAARAAADPLERGRQLMRQFQRPPPQNTLPSAEEQEKAVEEELAAEGASASEEAVTCLRRTGLVLRLRAVPSPSPLPPRRAKLSYSALTFASKEPKMGECRMISSSTVRNTSNRSSATEAAWDRRPPGSIRTRRSCNETSSSNAKEANRFALSA